MKKLLQVFMCTEVTCQILDQTIDDKDRIIDDIAYSFAKDFIYQLNSGSQATFELPIAAADLDNVASTHCDKWLEGASLHLTLYSGYNRPALAQPAIQGTYTALNFAKYKGYSGDISGVIGEALFGLILTKHFQLQEVDFAHFGTTSIIYPDFGVYCTSQIFSNVITNMLVQTTCYQKKVVNLPNFVLPAEVKAMASPSAPDLRDRISKAFRQLRSFWRTRNLTDQNNSPITRGPSIVFVALMNSYRQSYNGYIVWLT